jgi:hypothetical protein
VTYTADEDFAGQDTFTYTISDGREGGTVERTVTIDVTPQTRIDDGPAPETNDRTPTWTFSSPVDGVGFACTLVPFDFDSGPGDGGELVPCDDGTFTPDAELDEGMYFFYAAATKGELIDPTGAFDLIVIDLTAPPVTIDATPATLSNDRTPAFDFSSDDEDATFECRIDDAAFAACEPGDVTPSLDDGAHTFEVRAVDPATNRTQTPAAYDWDVDATAPVVTRTSGPAPSSFTNQRKPTWEWSRTDATTAHPAGHLVAASARCRVDEGAWTTPCPLAWQQPANLSDGPHTLHIEMGDAAGNVGTLAVPFTVDTIAPQATITGGPDSPGGPAATFAFISNEVGATFRCRMLGEAWPAEACTTGKAYEGLATGSYTFQLKAIDRAGNESTTQSWAWSVLGGAPDTVITGGPTGETTARTASFAFTSADGETFECRVDGGAYRACTSPDRLTGLALGAHTFEVRAVNAVGTPDATPAKRTWTVIDPPVEPAPPAKVADTPPAGPPAGQQDPPPAGPGPGPSTCSPADAAPRRSGSLPLGGGITAVVELSHGTARAGQQVTASLVVRGGRSAAARRSARNRVLGSVSILDGRRRVARLGSPTWRSTFALTAGPRTLVVAFERKRGKAQRRSVDLSVLPACA